MEKPALTQNNSRITTDLKSRKVVAFRGLSAENQLGMVAFAEFEPGTAVF